MMSEGWASMNFADWSLRNRELKDDREAQRLWIHEGKELILFDRQTELNLLKRESLCCTHELVEASHNWHPYRIKRKI